MTKHPVEVPGYTPEQLAKVLSNLDYRALSRYLYAFYVELIKWSYEDSARERPQLAYRLKLAGLGQHSSWKQICHAADIAEKNTPGED